MVKTMRVKAQEALYNFLSVVQTKCWNAGLLSNVGERQSKKGEPLYHRKHSSRSTLIGMAGKPVLCENSNLSITNRSSGMTEDVPRKKTKGVI